jgi:hypothetical protein
MSESHTKGRVAQGFTIPTDQTRRWSSDEWQRNEERERCLVFSGEPGRFRQLIASCHQSKDDARRIAACWNACDGLFTESLERGKPLAQQIVDALNERDRLLAALEGVLAITGDSTGVAGYHRNGEIAEWGEFEEISKAREVFEEVKKGGVK